MRKILIVAAAAFLMSTASWAGPCTGTLKSLVSAGSCTDVNGNLFGSISTNLTASEEAHLMVSSSASGGITIDIDKLAKLAGSSTTCSTAASEGCNSFALNFSITAPTGFNVSDLSFSVTGPEGVTLTLAGQSGTFASLTATTEDMTGTTTSTQMANFSGVSTLNLTATLQVEASARGSATLTITPSLTAISATPEPPALSLMALGFLGLAAAWGVKRTTA